MADTPARRGDAEQLVPGDQRHGDDAGEVECLQERADLLLDLAGFEQRRLVAGEEIDQLR